MGEDRDGAGQELLGEAFYITPTAIGVMRMDDGVFVDLNDAYARVIGLPRELIVGRSAQELNLWADPAERDEVIGEVRRSGGVENRTARFLTQAREVRVGSFSIRAVRHGSDTYTITTIHDVTDEVREEELRDRRDAILEAVGFAAQRFLRADDWEEVIEEVLARIGEAAGASRAHVFQNVTLADGRPGSTHRHEWCAPGVRPEIDNPDTIDQPWFDEQDDWRRRLGEGEPVISLVRDLPDAVRSEFEGQAIRSLLDMPVFDDREWWGTIGFDDCEREREWTRSEIDALRVASETFGAAIQRRRAERSLREAEELYRTLVEQIPAVAYVNLVSEEYIPIYTSPGIEELLGVTADAYRDRRLWYELVHPEDRERVYAEDEGTDRTLEPFRTEYRMLRPDGRVVWVRDEAEVIRDEQGEPRFWSGVMFDITALKGAEEDLARALELEREASAGLRALDEMKNTFLQAVSHDLRTPLAAVLGGALTLDRDDIELSPEESRDLVHRIATNAKKLARLASDLLDLDRLSQGLLEPNREEVDVGALVREVTAEVEQLTGRPFAVEVEAAVAAVDAPKVERIVENLLVNAAKHTSAETSIWVRTRRMEGGVLISVQDDGPGIPAEIRDAIFLAFERGPTASSHAPGSGIGLALVARFAELHGGRAWVEERPGGGSSFNVLLPDPVVE